MKGRPGDLIAAIRSDTPTLEKYRSIRRDRRILQYLINEP